MAMAGTSQHVTTLRPVNCDRLITPQVNSEIWGRLDKETRSKDLKLSYLQTNLAAVGNIVSQATDMLLTARAENSEVDIENLIRKNMDAIDIMGHISYDLAQRRRDVIRPTLNKEYATLCASHVPVTTLLFGTNCNANTTEPYTGIELNKKYGKWFPTLSTKAPFLASTDTIQIWSTKAFFMETSASGRQTPIQEKVQTISVQSNGGIRNINEQHFDRIAGKHIQYTLTFLASLS
jgi:hypothetical protein